MSDIRMPGMDGLEMVEIVEKEWPDCLTIFLTGHSEFEYARQAVGSRTIDYVLKLDGDEALRRAIDKAYDRLEKEQEEKSRLLKLNASMAGGRASFAKGVLPPDGNHRPVGGNGQSTALCEASGSRYFL